MNEIRKKENQREILRSVLLSLGIVAAITLVGFWFSFLELQDMDIMILYLIGVLLTARLTKGYFYGIAVTLISTFIYNYLFILPIFHFRVNDGKYFMTFFLMIVVAVMTSASTSQMKQAVAKREEKENESRALYHLSNALNDAGSKEQIVDIMIRTINDIFSCSAAWYEMKDKAEAEKMYEDGYDFWELDAQSGKLGCIRYPKDMDQIMSKDNAALMKTVLENATLAMDRLKHMEERRLMDDKVNQERYRANLLRSISHDIRTPLSGIMGTLEIMIDTTEEDDPKYMMEQQIYENSRWLYAMVENILNLTRLQDGKLILNKESQVLEELVESAIYRIGTMAPGYEISVGLPEEVILVPVDARLIQQMLLNLLDNAVKHTKPGDEIHVRAELLLKDKQVRITILDRGSGIPEEHLENIFELFYSLDNSKINARKGMGLGLPICQTIVSAHGGTIQAENRNDGPGLAVSFTLPIEEDEK